MGLWAPWAWHRKKSCPTTSWGAFQLSPSKSNPLRRKKCRSRWKNASERCAIGEAETFSPQNALLNNWGRADGAVAREPPHCGGMNMFARKVAVRLKPGRLDEFANLMKCEILLWLRKQ